MHSSVGHVVIFALPVVAIAYFLIMSAIDRRRLGAAAPMGFWRRNGAAIGTYLLVAVAFWAIVMIVLPQLFMFDMSFRPKLPPNQVGGERDVYTLANYRYFLFGSATSTSSWNSTHLNAFWLTLVASVVITAFNFALCYPLAFHMATTTNAGRLRLLLLLLIAPYWVNEILRAFAFRVLLSSGGVINNILTGVGITATPIDFLANDVGLYAGLSYAYLLLMVFPLYSAIESLDRNQIEAARDLGAPWWHIHAFIVMPHAKPGVASGCTLVFMLTAGALAAPLVLSGPRTLWFTPIVYDRFYQAFNWQQGAAYAFVLLVACIVFVLAVLRLGRLNLGDITR